MSDRMLQVNELLRDKLAHVFSQELEIPVDFFITITKVSASNDLRAAKVWLSVLPFDKARQGMAWVINHRKEVQRLLGKQTKKMKNTPILRFELDQSEQKSSEIYEIMDK